MKIYEIENSLLRWFIAIGACLGWVSALILFAALFSACATTTPPPSVVSHIEPPPPPVYVPRPVPCVEPKDIPSPPGTAEPDETYTVFQLSVWTRKKLIEWSAYAAKADSLLHGCKFPDMKP